MIIYDGIKTDFMNDVRDNLICNKIYEQYQRYFGYTTEPQMRAWQNSMQYMRNILDSESIPDNCGVAIEYNIPSAYNKNSPTIGRHEIPDTKASCSNT